MPAPGHEWWRPAWSGLSFQPEALQGLHRVSGGLLRHKTELQQPGCRRSLPANPNAPCLTGNAGVSIPVFIERGLPRSDNIRGAAYAMSPEKLPTVMPLYVVNVCDDDGMSGVTARRQKAALWSGLFANIMNASGNSTTTRAESRESVFYRRSQYGAKACATGLPARQHASCPPESVCAARAFARRHPSTVWNAPVPKTG